MSDFIKTPESGKYVTEICKSQLETLKKFMYGLSLPSPLPFAVYSFTHTLIHCVYVMTYIRHLLC